MRQRVTSLVLAVAALAFGLAGALGAQGREEPAVPEPLRPWVGWVLAEHPDLPCAVVAGERLCAWPGRLELDLDDRGGSFRVRVVADRELDLPLPGDASHWPRGVTLDGRPALLRRVDERPTVAVPPGSHELAGRFRWSRLPQSLPLPPAIGLVSLRIDGGVVAMPRREEGGLLWLAGRREEVEEERTALEVSRLVEDGVPVRMSVLLRLRVSGRAREVDLGDPLPEGFVPTAVRSSLPARLADGEDGLRLLAQLRPGEWQVAIEARSLGPVTEIPLVDRPDPWPDEEFWAFRSDVSVRAVKLEGAPGVDPQRTPMPEAWRTLPAFRLAPGRSLLLTELRRGQVPPPDSIAVRREWWLAERGDRITSRDRLTGSLNTGGRLEVVESARLGRAALGEQAEQQVITVGEASGRPGIEVRSAELDLKAELFYPRGGGVPAVGWDRSAQSLSVKLNLPPGWLLLAAPGADRAAGALLDAWTLLDLFFLLLLSLATWKLASWRWAALAFAVLGLAWHEPHATFLVAWWLGLLLLLALLRVLPKGGRAARLMSALRWAAVAAFLLQLVLFCSAQWQTGIFPQLEYRQVRGAAAPVGVPEYNAADLMTGRRAAMAKAGLAGSPQAVRFEAPGVGEIEQEPPAREAEELAAGGYVDSQGRARQVDAAAVVQTGPGVPRWSWHAYSLTWSGPVSPEQQVRLLLISPAAERLLSLLRIAGVLLLAFWLVDPRRHPPGSRDSGLPGEAAAAVLAILALLPGAPALAQAPPAGFLDELERRLTQPPPCAPECVEVASLLLAAEGSELRIEAEVHASAASAWPLPGPAAAWAPQRVTLDGQVAAALRRDEDGFLLLRLEPGIHRVVLSGAARDSVVLQMPVRPRTMEWRGDGWAIGGFRPDAPPPASVRLDRELPTASEAESGVAETSPWLELTRELDLGIPWLVHNEMRRLGPSEGTVSVAVPLLPGESVTTGDIPVEGGSASVTLERGETVRRWDSTLQETETLTLTAPADSSWLERWVLACSPIWTCRAEGMPPSRHMDDGRWRPEWRPWPGESLTLRLVRPSVAPGATTTLDAVELELTPGRRILGGELGIELRTSRGGEEVLTLPETARLQSLQVDGRPQPALLEGGRLVFTLEPGEHEVVAVWRQPHALGLIEQAPAVDLGSEAANVMLHLRVPSNRWLLWAAGPSWGSVVTLWLYLPLLVLAAWALGRWGMTPLSGLDWLLLGLGLTQVALPFAAIVVLWLVAFAFRDRFRAEGVAYRRAQTVALGALWVAALAVLYAVIHIGLLGRPEMQIAGLARSDDVLSWYRDLVPGALPRPWVLWLPLWVFRVLMLLWALWLSARLLGWLPWAWRRLLGGEAVAADSSDGEGPAAGDEVR